MLKVLHGGVEGAEEAHRPDADEAGGVDLDELCRLAAREMIAVALEAERRAYLEAHADAVDAAGRGVVVGNGYARARQITTAAGRVEVRAPAGGRPPGRRAVHLGDPAAVHAPQPEGHRGAADPVPAGVVDRRLRAGVGGLLRFRRGLVCLDGAAVDRGVARRA